MGLGQWLLVSGLQQISQDLQMIEALLMPPPADPLLRFLLEGRRRELTAARSLLLWLWGPLQLGLQDAVPLTTSHDQSAPVESASVAITLRERNAIAVWGAIRSRLDGSVQAGLTNATGGLLALEGLNLERRRQLLLALLQQLDLVLARLRGSDGDPVQSGAWAELQRNCGARPSPPWPAATSGSPGKAPCCRWRSRCWARLISPLSTASCRILPACSPRCWWISPCW